MSKKNFLWLLPLSLTALLVGWFSFSFMQAPQVISIALPSLKGKQLEIPHPEKKLTLVHFWSVSCGPCMEELPNLEQLYRQYIEKHPELELITVAMPYDPPNIVLETRDRLDITMPITLDLQGQAVQRFARNMATPAHFLVNQRGQIVFQRFGPMEMKTLERVLEQYLAT